MVRRHLIIATALGSFLALVWVRPTLAQNAPARPNPGRVHDDRRGATRSPERLHEKSSALEPNRGC